MIKVNELRIGNWVEYNNRLWKVGSITDFPTIGVSDSNEECLLNEELSMPIPLTPDILEECEFIEIGSFLYKGKFSISLPSDDKLLWKNGRTYFNSWNIGDAPKYLHQIQNMYFALTGDELNVQLSNVKLI